MAKTKLFESWTFRLQLPPPFDDPKYSGAKPMGFSQYNTSSTAQKATLHAPTLRALLAYYCHPFYQELDRLPCYLGNRCDNPHCIFKDASGRPKVQPSEREEDPEEGGDDDG